MLATLIAIILLQFQTIHYEKPPEPLNEAIITGYSSTPDQTDDTPFIMASGKRVYDGAIANNCLPFGSKVLIDQEIFTVEDRMNKRYGCEYYNTWFPSRELALNFGKQNIWVKSLSEL